MKRSEETLKKMCHYCEHCIEKHDDDKGIPCAKCTLHNQPIIEYHTFCDNFKLAA